MSFDTGVWIVGAKGGVATTLIAGTLGILKGHTRAHGMITETELFRGIELPALEGFVFGGHDIRVPDLLEGAEQIYRENGSIPHELLEVIQQDLGQIDRRIRPGVLFRSGRAIESLADREHAILATSAADAIDRIAEDLREFRSSVGDPKTVVVVNLASTEPPLRHRGEHDHADGIRDLVEARDGTGLIASSLYALAAAKCRCPYINFTPSPGALLPGIAATFEATGLPFMGSDGKTGETLVKSALAPMFKYRNLRVLSWQGYNMLGDRDGQVLADEENKRSKVATKDQLLQKYLGYPLHTQVAIDYVPSLHDLKTAWDFIHFQGFLDYKMSLQFTWQGCDAVLAAPVVLDLIRLLTLAHRRAAQGAQVHLSAFFKQPYGVEEHDLHFQFHRLLEYVEEIRAA